jgi:hypothetical protein
MTAKDRAALERALTLVLRDSDRGRVEQVRDLLKDDWQSTARFCAYLLQKNQLGLRPWDRPPASESISVNGGSAASRLLAKMLAAGLSRYTVGDALQRIVDDIGDVKNHPAPAVQGD